MVESDAGFPLASKNLGRASTMAGEDILIEPITPEDEKAVIELISETLKKYDEAGSVLASTFRRVEKLLESYNTAGARFFVARDMQRQGQPIGGVGIGSLHGLPPSEGMGEVRDLVVQDSYRGKGIGTRLLSRSIEWARSFGYQRLYLETTPQMENAQKLFVRFRFRPVTQAQTELTARKDHNALPCYYLLEDLTDRP